MLESDDDSFLREYTSEKLSGFLRVIVSVLVCFLPLERKHQKH
jgi:hypothetical protein